MSMILFSEIRSVTNLGKGRPRLETGATDDGLLGYLKQQTQSGDDII